MADSPTARVTKLEQRSATLEERIDAVRRQVDGADLPALAQRLAVLESQVKDLREGKQEWARRAWTIVGPLLGATVGAVLTYIFRR
jgi:tetrahydromethanopterin S-methyltransferase subunit G